MFLASGRLLQELAFEREGCSVPSSVPLVSWTSERRIEAGALIEAMSADPQADLFRRIAEPERARLFRVLEAGDRRRPISTTALADREEVARLIGKYNLLAISVLDAEQRVIGIVTVDVTGIVIYFTVASMILNGTLL